MEYDRKNLIEELCMELAINIVNASKRIAKTKHEYNMTDQVLRAGTAIGALYGEAQFAESDKDYVHKIKISLKECHETKYWLELLIKTNHLDEKEGEDLYMLTNRVQKMLMGCVKKARMRIEN